ncbi:hypothetical protein LTR17_001801 [Elasticomyces elasticus]|nr:hypothetical protein LTR17_001801 [Elasticomyces elasticus]
MAEAKALHEQMDAFVASQEASEEALRQHLDEALKVADYLKQKLDSLEDIIDDLSNGQDVKAVFKGYSDDMESLEQAVLQSAALRQTNGIEARAATPTPENGMLKGALPQITKILSPPQTAYSEGVEARKEKIRARARKLAEARTRAEDILFEEECYLADIAGCIGSD